MLLSNEEIQGIFDEAVTSAQKITISQLYYTKMLYELMSKPNDGLMEDKENMATKSKALYEPKPVGPSKMMSSVQKPVTMMKEAKNGMDKKATPRKSK